MRVAVVLSGGGAKGAYEVGALKVLCRKLPQIDLVCGSSIGALNGAAAAEGVEAGDLQGALEELERQWLQARGVLQPNWSGLARAAFAFIRSGPSRRVLEAIPSLLSNQPVRRMVSSLVPSGRRLSDYQRVELAVTATNLNTGRLQVFDRATAVPVIEAVLASSAYPGAFPTVQVEGSSHVDGGALNNTPFSVALRHGATHAYVVSLKPQQKEDYFAAVLDNQPFDNIYAVMQRLAGLILDKAMYDDLKQARRTNAVLRVLEKMPADAAAAVRELRAVLGLDKDGAAKRYVHIVEIAPKGDLTPPGTFGFNDRQAIERLIRRGEEDAERELAALAPPAAAAKQAGSRAGGGGNHRPAG